MSDPSSSSSSSSGITINPKVFWSRVSSLYQHWKSAASSLASLLPTGSSSYSLPLSASASKSLGWGVPAQAFQSKDSSVPIGVVDCILLTSGSGEDSDSSDYSRLLSIQFHLLGYEVPDTAILLTRDPDRIIILTSPKKAKLLAPLNADGLGGAIALEFVEWNKSDRAGSMSRLLDAARATKGGKRVGEIAEKSSASVCSSKAAEREDGAFCSQVWKEFTRADCFDFLDVSAGLGNCLLVKDATARSALSTAADLSTRALKKYLLPEIETIIDEEKSMNQVALADATEEALRDPARLGLTQCKAEDVDSCYNPIIQSGGGVDFDLRPSAQTANIDLQYRDGTSIVVQLGGRYRNYCANLGRTYFINPSEDQKEVYLMLTQVYIACKQAMKPGQKISAVYNAAVKMIQQSKKPELLEKFTKNVGFSIGLEFREAAALLNDKIQKPIQRGMIFNLSLGFSGLVNSAGNPYAVLLADTLVINDEEPESLTKMPREFKDIAYFLGDAGAAAEAAAAPSFPESGARATRAGTRGGDDQATNESTEKARAEHQAELQRRQREAALKRLASQEADQQFRQQDSSVDSSVAESYSAPTKFPPQAKRDRIYVDVSAESVLLPIGDLLVPFHINTIKNVHKQIENDFTYLRINFTGPENKGADNKKYISELTYRSQGPSLDKVYFDIKELRKRVQNRQKELEARSSLVIQEELKIDKRGNIPMLKDIAVRPQLSRKKTIGTLAAHLNGLRFVSTDKLKVDIIYANIKAAFYQPAEESHQVLLHFELKDPILLDKSKTKKTNFLQFYVEVVEVSEDLSTVNRYRDEDGLLEEQEERKRRKRWNERFLNFVKEVEDKLGKAADEPGNSGIPRLEFDIPYRELAFTGVPGKSSVTLMPTVHSLVALEDIPPLVLTLGEVEIANFERVQFGLRNFDLTFVWKDFNRLPLRIDSIPIKFLDPLKHWLNSCDIVYYESPSNILWKNVMKAITEDIEGFWEEGGWAFLAQENDDGEGSENGEAVESGSEFEPSDEDEDDSEEYETASEEESGEEESEGSEEEGSEDEEGESWEELEEKAIRADKEKKAKMKERGFDDDEDEEERRPKKKVKQ